MYISFNASQDWYFGVDGLGPGNQFDFLSVATHEIAHGLGWVSTIEADGTGPSSLGERYSIYDTWVWSTTHNNWLINLAPGLIASELISGNLFWGGPMGIAANGGLMPELYSPPVYRSGSSVDHLDSVGFNGALMEPFRSRGEVVHSVSEVEKGILKDIFWTFAPRDLQPVPEPSTCIIFFGLGLTLVWSGRHRV